MTQSHKTFFASMYNKLECFLSCEHLHPSLIFASKEEAESSGAPYSGTFYVLAPALPKVALFVYSQTL